MIYDFGRMRALRREAKRRRRDGNFLQQGLTSQFFSAQPSLPKLRQLVCLFNDFLVHSPMQNGADVGIEDLRLRLLSCGRACRLVLFSKSFLRCFNGKFSMVRYYLIPCKTNYWIRPWHTMLMAPLSCHNTECICSFDSTS